MAVRSDKVGQSWILSPAISGLIPIDHICYLIIAIVNSIDVSEVEQKYRSGPGNPAYSCRMLLRLEIIASVDPVWSSRKIAKLAHENVVYMHLTGNEKPDFRQICNLKSCAKS
jgi:transposase